MAIPGSMNRLVGLTAIAAVVGCFAGCGQAPVEKIGSIYDWKADPTEANRAKIRALLGDPDHDVRATALHALVTLDVPDSEELALGSLDDEDGFVRSTAAKLLGDVGNPAAAGALVGPLLEDTDPVVRQRAAESLAELGGTTAVEGLARALADPMKEVRLAAVKGLRELDPAYAAAALARIVLEDPEWEIRVQAANALGLTGDAEMAPVLEKAGEDENEFVRSAASEALNLLAKAGDAGAEKDRPN